MKHLLTSLVIVALITVSHAKPNIILIISDDLGYADLGCQGSKDVKTPHIDSLAQNGTRFTHGYVTSPQCGPSRAGLLTGRYQARFGFESNFYARKPSIPVSEKLISDRMKAAGYVTGYIDKWGVGNQQASGLTSLHPNAASMKPTGTPTAIYSSAPSLTHATMSRCIAAMNPSSSRIIPPMPSEGKPSGHALIIHNDCYRLLQRMHLDSLL